jgi:hypothetical protein
MSEKQLSRETEIKEAAIRAYPPQQMMRLVVEAREDWADGARWADANPPSSSSREVMRLTELGWVKPEKFEAVCKEVHDLKRELTRLQSQQAEGMREAFAELIEKYKRVTFSHYLNMPEHRALSRQYKQEYDLKAMRFCEEEVAKYVALLEPSAPTPDKNREL